MLLNTAENAVTAEATIAVIFSADITAELAKSKLPSCAKPIAREPSPTAAIASSGA